MNARYRPLRSGRRLLAQASLAAIVVAAGVYIVLDRPRLVVPAPVTAPDTVQRFTKAEPAHAPVLQSKTPAAAEPIRQRTARRVAGSGVFKCQESNGAITYAQFPCDEGKQVDISPTSGGFAENWSISVTQR